MTIQMFPSGGGGPHRVGDQCKIFWFHVYSPRARELTFRLADKNLKRVFHVVHAERAQRTAEVHS